VKLFKILTAILIVSTLIACDGKNGNSTDERVGLTEEKISPRVGILNGCGIDGIAVSLGEKLIDEGWTLSIVDNWEDYEGNPIFDFERTVVFYNKEIYKNDAAEIAELLKVSVVDFRSDLHPEDMDVGIIIGNDLDVKLLEVLSEGDESIVEAWVVIGTPPEQLKDGIYVSKKFHTVTLFRDGEIVLQFPCATGVDYSTPEGTYTLTVKLVDPTWYWEGKAIPPGPDNGLGTRFLGISKKSYGIHGTNEPSSIGRDISHGCIRMYNRDVEVLYENVEVGDVVKIGP